MVKVQTVSAPTVPAVPHHVYDGGNAAARQPSTHAARGFHTRRRLPRQCHLEQGQRRARTRCSSSRGRGAHRPAAASTECARGHGVCAAPSRVLAGRGMAETCTCAYVRARVVDVRARRLTQLVALLQLVHRVIEHLLTASLDHAVIHDTRATAFVLAQGYRRVVQRLCCKCSISQRYTCNATSYTVTNTSWGRRRR